MRELAFTSVRLIVSLRRNARHGIWSAAAAMTAGTPPHRRASCASPRRDPESTPLHRVIQQHYAAFLEHAQQKDRVVPWFVRRETEAFLRCGILRHGFLRLRCESCGDERPIPFSCKGRSVCTSCSGRRMADTAARWVDRVIPTIPTRQWVVSFPFALRYVLAYDHLLCSEVLRLFLHSIFASLRRRARSELGLTGPSRRLKCGAVTALQRFGDGLRLNLHIHSIVLDGVYEMDPRSPTGSPIFHPLSPPDDAEVARVLQEFARRLQGLLEQRGQLANDGQHLERDELAEGQPLLALLYGASIQSRVALGRRAGQRLQRIGDQIDLGAIDFGSTPRCASASGLNLHANVSIHGNDRRRLERLARYILRPPLAQERLSLIPDGRILYQLKTPWKDGTHHLAVISSRKPTSNSSHCAMKVGRSPQLLHELRYSALTLQQNSKQQARRSSYPLGE